MQVHSGTVIHVRGWSARARKSLSVFLEFRKLPGLVALPVLAL